MTNDVRALQLAAMPERQFLDYVVARAGWLGWHVYHTHDSRRSQPGFPDLVMVRDGRMIVAELKRQKGTTTGPQKAWLEAFGTVAKQAPNITVRLWRPSDIDEIDRLLE